MAFYHVRFIKGNPYLYYEWRWREDGLVKSDGCYIAALNRHTGEIWSKPVTAQIVKAHGHQSETFDAHRQEMEINRFLRETPAKLMAGWGAERIEAAPRPKRQAQAYAKPPRGSQGTSAASIGATVSSVGSKQSAGQGRASLDLRIQFRKFKVSEKGMLAEHQAHQGMMRNMSSDAAQMAPVMVRHPRRFTDFIRGIQGNVSRQKRMGTYVVTMPRWKRGNRDTVRREYRKALAFSLLDGIKASQPSIYQHFGAIADQVRRNRNRALAEYIKNTGSKTKLARSLAIGTPLAQMHAIPISKRSKLDPATLGLFEYGKRKSWREEFASLMAEAATHAPQSKKGIDYDAGLTKLGKATDKRLGSIRAGIRIVTEEMQQAPLLERLSGKSRNRAKQLKRLYARQVLFTEKHTLIRATQQMLFEQKKPTVEALSPPERRKRLREGMRSYRKTRPKDDLSAPKTEERFSQRTGTNVYARVQSRPATAVKCSAESVPGENRARFLYDTGILNRGEYRAYKDRLKRRHERLLDTGEFGVG